MGAGLCLILMRAILQMASLFFGSVGIVAFYGSFRHPGAAAYALGLLTLATVIALLMPRRLL